MLHKSLKRISSLVSAVVTISLLATLAAVTMPTADLSSHVLACDEPQSQLQPLHLYQVGISSFSGGLGSSPMKHYYTNPLTLAGDVSAINFVGGIGQYSIQVDWGDGATSNVSPSLQVSQSGLDFTGIWGQVSHIYASSQIYSVKVTLCLQESPVAQAVLMILITTVDHIVVIPKTATLNAGQSQTYSVEAFDNANNSFGIVTASTYFSIESEAGGSWTGGIYTSSKAGSWTVNANYQCKIDTASLTVNANPGSNLASPPTSPAVVQTDGTTPTPTPTAIPERNYLTVDFLGAIAKGLLSIDGSLADTLVVISPDGAHTLQFQAGTRIVDSTGVTVTSIKVREADQIFQLPSDLQIVGSAYDFEPSGTVLLGSVNLTLGYDVNQLPKNLATVSLAFYAGGSIWTDLSTVTSPSSELGRIMASIQHLSTFAVIAKVSPVNFKLSDLTITTSPSSTVNQVVFFKRSGQEATISALVTNTGGQPGSYNITLKLNGTERETKAIYLEPGQSQEVSFTVADIAPGRYDVAVNELTGEFSSRIIINWLLIGLLVLIFLILVGIIVIVARRRRNSGSVEQYQ